MNGFIEVTVSYQSAGSIGGVRSNVRTTVPRLLNVAHIRYVKPAQWWDAAIGAEGAMQHGSAVSVSEGVGSGQYDVAESYDEVKAMIVAATGSPSPAAIQKYLASAAAVRALYADSERARLTDGDWSDALARADECADDLACEAQRILENMIGLS